MSQITIVHIITKLELGGAQKVCLTLCKKLPELGTKTILISGTHGPLVSEAQQLTNVLLLDNLTREISHKNIIRELKLFFKLIKILKNLKKKYPTIIVHTHSTKAGICGRWAAFFAGIKPRIHTIHGFGFHEHQSWASWIPIYMLEYITSIITTKYICVSEKDRDTGIKFFPRFSNKNTVIRAAVDYEKYYIPARTFTARAHPFFTFGTIACFKPQKNIFDTLKAFQYTHTYNPATRLEIIGDGEQRAQIAAWITEHELTHAILLHGWQHHIAPFLAQWDTFILTSLWEGLPCAIIEARLSKLPVLSYNTGGISEVIFSGKNGYIYPQKSWKLLAQDMITLSHNKSLHSALSNYPDNLQEFTYTHMVQQHNNLYRNSSK